MVVADAGATTETVGKCGVFMMIGVAAMMAGCVQIHVDEPKPGEFSNYREFAYNRARMMSWRGVPADLQARARICAVDATIPYFTPVEMERLDAYARGEGGMTDADITRMDREIESRIGGETGVEAALQRTCPETVHDLKAWAAENPA
jgi:hypothetical protein